MKENRYHALMGSELNLCTTIINGDRIGLLSYQAIAMAGLTESDIKPQIILDLDQIFVLNYTKIPENTQEQNDYIEQQLKQSPLAPDELTFLALRSLYSLAWDKLETQENAIFALKAESALNYIIKEVSTIIAGDLTFQDYPLPSWVRISFLRAMSKIPSKAIENSKLKSVTCFPTKKVTFNAFSIILNESAIVGFNYALEPILKILNRFFFHFYSTQHLSGPIRIERAWCEILPVVRYFSGNSSTKELMSGCIIKGTENAIKIKNAVSDQIDFIMMHELGHIYHNHHRWFSKSDSSTNEVEKRHHFEFEADEFSIEIFKSWLMESLESKEEVDCKINEYSLFVESIELLFIYMSFIENAKHILRKKKTKISPHHHLTIHIHHQKKGCLTYVEVLASK